MKIIISLVVGLLASCASAPRQELLSSQRITVQAFSWVPPAGAGWFKDRRVGVDRSLLIKAHEGGDPYENYVIDARILTAPLFQSNEDFLRAAQSGKSIQENASYRVLAHAMEGHVVHGEYCALYKVTVEDRSNTPSLGFGVHRRLGYMLMDRIELSCRHPQDKTKILDIAFSLSYYPGEADQELMSKAMSVVNSIQFLKTSVDR
ncbi:hypothetical protein [Leptothrix ochracea]|uniref:hypothetical protein n=1 Tax=Leptothrix ochracea TaxID=735331 RepID=UPI0034E28CE6